MRREIKWGGCSPRQYTSTRECGSISLKTSTQIEADKPRIIAYHCDSPPHIVWAEVDWDPTAGVLLMDWPLRVSRAESAFSVDLAQPTRVAETATVLENDAHWAQLARAISQANVPPPRTSKEAPANEPTLGWAVIRVYWCVPDLGIHTLIQASDDVAR